MAGHAGLELASPALCFRAGDASTVCTTGCV